MGHIATTEYLVHQLPGTPADLLAFTTPLHLVKFPPGELPGITYLKNALNGSQQIDEQPADPNEFAFREKRGRLVEMLKQISDGDQIPKKKRTRKAAADAVA